jgi:DNA-binding MarR family transcriptional regulator
MIEQLADKDIKRFWSKVNIKGKDECWEWNGKIGNNHAGTITIKKKVYVPYRISYFLKNGTDNPNQDVFHSCDNLSCVNPRHLYIKKHAESIYEDEYFIKSFWSKVDIKGDTDCWDWKAYSDEGGGSFYVGSGMMGACRFLYILKNGEISKNSRVKHYCKNIRCCNPTHLYLDVYDGTIYDNAFTDRFWRRVDIKDKDDCWNWIAGKDEDGYGFVEFHGVTYRSTHIAYMITRGEIEKELFICHKCDNPSCVNPDHLFLGTCLDNVKDRHLKNRDAKGSAVGTSKLNENEIEEILELYFNKKMMSKDIAKKYGVHRSTIGRVVSGEYWGQIHKNRGSFNNGRKLTKELAQEIRNLYAEGVMQKDIANKFNINPSTVSNVVSYRRWPNNDSQ